MPPKKRSVEKANKTEKKKKSGEVLDDGKDLREKFRRNDMEVAVLREHLALRAEAVRRAQSISADLWSRVRELEQKVTQGQRDKRDITAELNRQNLRAQSEMEIQVRRLETEVSVLSQQLAECRGQLGTLRDAHERMAQEKDATIADLQEKLDRMDSEKILHDCLDSLLALVAGERQKWQRESTFTHQELKCVLSEFNLNPLHIGTSWNPVVEVKGWPALQCKWSG